jgi:PAS domain S-box-containing protein
MTNKNADELAKCASDSMYKSIIENSNDAIVVISDSVIVYVNKVTIKLCGYDSLEEMIGKNALNFISPRFRDHYRERIKSRMEGNPQPDRFDHEILKKDGSIVQMETTASIIEYKGKPAVLFIGRDITERKKFESKLFALHRYAAQLGAAQTLVEISEPTLNAIRLVMGFKYANFMVREDDHLGCIQDIGFGVPYWNVSIAAEGGISRAAREARTVQIDDPKDGIEDNLLQMGMQSQLAMPVIIKDRVELVISVESMAKGAFTDSDVQILRIIAQHAGSALERIDSYK